MAGGGDDQELQDGACQQGPGHPRSADYAADQYGADGQGAADAAGQGAVGVLQDDRGQDSEPDDDRFHTQHGAAELPDALPFQGDVEPAHDSSAAVNEWREG